MDVARYDAVVIMSESFKQDKYLNELAARCKKAAVPVISVVKCLDNCINFIYDYGDTFGQIVEHLIEHHGYRRFAFMAGIKDNIFSEQRYEAFLEVLRAHNIDFDTSNLYYGGFWEIPCLEATDELLKKGIDDIDAIVCANDSMAITVINKLKQNGYSVPEDAAMTGCSICIWVRNAGTEGKETAESGHITITIQCRRTGKSVISRIFRQAFALRVILSRL